MNIISKKLGKDNRKFVLAEEPECSLQDLNIFLPKLMSLLWKQPNIVASILRNASNEELKEYLAPFIANNFYENILSPYGIEDNLMYVLSLLIKDEINNLKDLNEENFLNNSPTKCLLEELKRKRDIQAFFHDIIFNAVEDLNQNHSSLNLNFIVSKIKKELKESNSNLKNQEQMKNTTSSYYLSNEAERINLKDNEIKDKEKMKNEQDNFYKKYIPSLDKEALEKILEGHKNNKRMYDYCNSKLKDCQTNEDYFSNKQFLENLYKSELSQEILSQYQQNFIVVIYFINSILDKIINNLHLLPYSIKCLCKIISTLIDQKFISINEIKKMHL